MDFATAIDIVDTYGPYRKGWPATDVSALDALAANDNAFAEYLEQAREIEDQLSCWEEAPDGVEIEDDDAEGGAAGGEHDADGSAINVDPTQIVDVDSMLAKFIEDSMADRPGYSVFTKDFDGTVAIDATGATVDKLAQATARAVGPLQKEMTRLIAAKVASTRLPGQRKGRLHGPALHRVITGDDRVFTRKQEAPKLDTAISMLIDCSASMLSGAGRYGGGNYSSAPIVLAVQAAYALGSVLQRIGVPFEVLGYTTRDGRFKLPDGYHQEVAQANAISPVTRAVPIEFPVFKEFQEPFNIETQRRFGAVNDAVGKVQMRGTIEGCAVEFAARRLLKQKEQRKLMIVLSDGQPCGPVYHAQHSSTPFSDAHAYMNHAREMAAEVTKAGVDLLGVGIMYSGLEGYYPNAITIQNIAEMPQQILGALKRFLLK